jgi:hypothetical protein
MAPHDLVHSRHFYIQSTKTERFAFTNTRYLVSITLTCVIESVDGRANKCLIGFLVLSSKRILRPFRLLLPQPASIRTFCRYASRYSRECPAYHSAFHEVRFRFANHFDINILIKWCLMLHESARKISCWCGLSWKHAGPLNNRVTSVNLSVLQLRLRKSCRWRNSSTLVDKVMVTETRYIL